MKKLLAALLLSSALTASVPAHADLPTIDFSNLIAQAKNLQQAVLSYTAQLRQLTAALQTLEQVITLTSGLIHNPNIGEIMILLQTLGLNPSLPVNPFAIQSMINGYGGISGELGSLSSLANTSFSANNIYTCTANSFFCKLINARMNGLSSQQGIAAQTYQDFQNHLQALQTMRDHLANSPDPKDAQDVQAQIEVEESWLKNHAAQLQAVGLMTSAQHDITSVQMSQKWMMDYDTFHAAVAGQ